MGLFCVGATKLTFVKYLAEHRTFVIFQAYGGVTNNFSIFSIHPIKFTYSDSPAYLHNVVAW